MSKTTFNLIHCLTMAVSVCATPKQSIGLDEFFLIIYMTVNHIPNQYYHTEQQ